MEFKHTSVLLEEVLEGLCIRPDGIYIDGTLGGGGHSFEIASRLTQGGHLIGIDQDDDALTAAGERLAPFGDRVTFVHDNYENMESTGSCWIWVSPPISLTTPSAVFPTARMRPWICVWTALPRSAPET